MIDWRTRVDREQYRNQVVLLLDCLPALKKQEIFALKGGTAINFFIRHLPRLSVDIDLAYVKIEPRENTIAKIANGLRALGKTIVKRNKKHQIRELTTREGQLYKIIVENGPTKIKIEPNFIMRGTLLPTIKMDIVKAVENKFEYSVKQVPILAEEELFAGKICAALSRQHPRDFFDIQQLFEKQGITDGIRQAFVIYLVCSPKPIHELLRPNLIVLKNIYENEFVNMTEAPVSLGSLLDTREILIKTINQDLSNNEKDFIFSMKKGDPDYSLMPFDHLDDLPALKWKLMNIRKMDKNKHTKMLNKLAFTLDIIP
jgi:predicted nucleotidyltransferase component of viral defense system